MKQVKGGAVTFGSLNGGCAGMLKSQNDIGEVLANYSSGLSEFLGEISPLCKRLSIRLRAIADLSMLPGTDG